jgi:hypothetical protein
LILDPFRSGCAFRFTLFKKTFNQLNLKVIFIFSLTNWSWFLSRNSWLRSEKDKMLAEKFKGFAASTSRSALF